MPDRNRRQDRQRRPQQDVPVIHEAPPFEPPARLAVLSSPLVYVAVGVVAGLALFGIAFAIRSDTDSPDVVGPAGSPTPTTAVEGTPTEGPTPTPDPRMFEEAEDVIDAENVDYFAVIETDKGRIEMDLFEEIAPNTVNNFVFLARQGYFDSLTWHNVVDNFIAETGDPRTADGAEVAEEAEDGPGYLTSHETTDLKNTRGTVSMSKEPAATNFGSKFFINLKDNPGRDASGGSGTAYYPFAAVSEGLDVVDRIEQGDVIESITIEEREKPEPTPEPDDG